MVTLVDSPDYHAYHPLLSELADLFQSEWGEVEPFSSEKNGVHVPHPILALHDARLVGGLAFTRFPAPKTDVQGLWVNAIFVKPAYRKQGVSSRLITQAEGTAKSLGEPAIFAYTHIPKLYEKLGWQGVEPHGAYVVVSKSFN